MAIIFEGYSKCPICTKVLDRGKEFTAFPPLISNTRDKVYLFSDAGVHVDCLNEHPTGQLALFYRNEYHKSFESNRCVTDGLAIEDPRNILNFGLLSSDTTEELSTFNFLKLNTLNIAKWRQREAFLQVADKFIKEGKWDGFMGFNSLERLMGELKR